MNLEELLREENYHLKNQITDLKNVFDINRDILRLIAHHDNPNDHEHRLLIQIITKLTAINNQALHTNLQLTQEKAFLKEENLKVNLELNSLQKRYALDVEINRNSQCTTDLSTSPYESNSCLQPELEIKQKTADAVYRSNNLLQTESSTKITVEMNGESITRRKRKYTEVESIMLEQSLKEARKEVIVLKRHVQQLESRLILLIKAFRLQEEAQKKKPSMMIKEIGESQLIKYALNDIKVVKMNDKQTLRIHNRIGSRREAIKEIKQQSYSWPKHKDFTIDMQSTRRESHKRSQKQ